MIEDEKINKYVRDVCEILSVEVPIILYEGNDTQKNSSAQTVFANGTYTLKIVDGSINPSDTYFVVARELRHMWQMITDRKKYFGDYLVAPNISEEDQSAQISEIDCTAFAMYIMRRFFSLTPKVINSPEISNLIELRYNAIVNNYNDENTSKNNA